MKYIYSAMLLFTAYITYSQNFNYKELSKEISINNRLGRYQDSNTKLLNIISNYSLNSKELAQLNLLLATTYRSLNDYPAALKYLLIAKEDISTYDSNDSLNAGIMSEMAHTYFDMQNYEESDKIMSVLQSVNYKNIEPLDKAYILMQKGYIYFIRNDFKNAEKLFDNSLHIINNVAPCHKPVIMVKYMELYGAQKKFDEVESIYKQTFTIADSCNILKYKIYALEELTRIYNKNNISSAFEYNQLLDSLKNTQDRNKNISDIHLKTEEHIKASYDNEQKYIWVITIIVILVLIIIFILFYLRIRKRHNILRSDTLGTIIYPSENRKIPETVEIKKSDTLYNDKLNLENLTDRQNEIIEKMIKGLSNKEIADELFLSEATVKYHIKNIYEKLNIKSRKDLLGKLYNK